MAYRFTKDELLADGIRRIVEQRLETSITRLNEKQDRLAAVHQVRKDIKKLRAVLRLVRNEVGNKVYRRDAATLRDAAQRLAGTRDARVKLDTFDALVAHFKTQLPAHPFPRVRQQLEKQLRLESKRFMQMDTADAVVHILEKLTGRVVDWQPDETGWSTIASGIQRSYQGGRLALRAAEKSRTAEHFHEWRKRAKDLWYDVRLICHAWPDVLGALSDQLEDLSDYLGDHHDLAVLRETIVSTYTANSKAEVETLAGLIDLRQRELESVALSLGQRLYMEKPLEFCRRLGKYWQVWHCEDAEKSFLEAMA